MDVFGEQFATGHVGAQDQRTLMHQVPDCLVELANFPLEIRFMIYRAYFPKGRVHRFNGFSDSELQSVRIPALLLVGFEALPIWFANSRLVFEVRPLPDYDLERVSDSWSSSRPPHENDLEAAIRRVGVILSYTNQFNLTLDIQSDVWRLFPQFFRLIELLQKYDFPVTFNIPFPIHTRGINITFAFTGGANARNIMRAAISLAHDARRSKMSPADLKSRYDKILRDGGYNSSMSKPQTHCHVQRFSLASYDASLTDVFIGPAYLLYSKRQAAAYARKRVNDFKLPSIRSCTDDWLDRVLSALQDYSEKLGAILRLFIGINDVLQGIPLPTNWREAYQESAHIAQMMAEVEARSFQAYACATLPNRVFGRYSKADWAYVPTTRDALIDHVLRASDELHRTYAHIDGIKQARRGVFGVKDMNGMA